MTGLIPLLIAVLIACLLVWLCFWLIDSTGIPHPLNVVAKIIVALVAVLIVLQRSGYVPGLM